MTFKIPQTIKIPLLDYKVPLWFGPLWLGISICVFIILLYLVVDRAIFLSKSEPTLGTVTKLTANLSSCGFGEAERPSTVFIAEVNYFVESDNYTLSVNAGEICSARVSYSEARYRVRDQVPIVYNRDHPNEAYRDHTWDIWSTPIKVFFALSFTLFLGFRKGSIKEPETPDKDIQKQRDSVASDIPVRNAGEVLTTETFDYKYSYLYASFIGPIGLVLLAGGILVPGWLPLKLLFSAFGVVLIVMTCASTVRVTVSPEGFKISNLIPQQVSYLLPRYRSRSVLWEDVFDLEIRNEYENVFIVYITLKDEGHHSRPGVVIRFSSGAVQNFNRLRSLLEQRWEYSKISA